MNKIVITSCLGDDVVAPEYVLPRYLKNQAGAIRRVGFELEFSDISIRQAAEVVANSFSGKIQVISDVQMQVFCDQFGTFIVELDWELCKEIATARKNDYPQSPSVNGGDLLMDWLTWLAGKLVPVEVICPPLPVDQLSALDTMVNNLRDAGAKGTEESVLYAFGVHINAEIPAVSPPLICRYLQAYGVAQDWLLKTHHVDPIRRITPYINPYPEEYLDRLFAYGENVTADTLITDYLEYNNTRNRALDMLPLWLYLQPAAVEGLLEEPVPKGRPAFHYRLPNCEIEKPSWSLRESWNVWCVVEWLVADPDILNRCLRARQEAEQYGVFITEKSWHDELQQIYLDLKSG